MPSLTGRRLERALLSKQFRGGRFHNTSNMGPSMSGSMMPILADFFFGGKRRTPRTKLPMESPVATWRTAPSTGLRVTWFGHSTVLLEMNGATVLTDPHFGMRASPFFFTGRTRFHRPPATIAELPPIDLVLLSHDHYDHLNAPSIRQLAAMRVPFVTSLGVGTRLEKLGVETRLISELDWWESYEVKDGAITVTATPAQHFSGRGIADRNLTLWSSWVLRSPDHRVFFSADTGLTTELEEIGVKLGPFGLIMLEIGASNPAWSHIHLGPANAMRAFEMLGAGALMPIHWSTFDLALHRWDEPAERLIELAEQSGARVLTPMLGRPIEPTREDTPSRWWRGVK